MTRIWLGDFRGVQLQHYIENIKKVEEEAERAAEIEKEAETEDETNESAFSNNILEVDNLYLMDSAAEYSWLESIASTLLPSMALSNTDVILMLGFNDCVRSCVWEDFDDFKIEKILDNYITLINKILEEYSGINLYVCSISPIQADYPFSEHKNGIIPKDKLQDKIKLFNETIKSSCEVMFIDSYTYLIEAGFNTRDGIRLTVDSLADLYNYILSQLIFGGAFTSFPLRADVTLDEDGNFVSAKGIPPKPSSSSEGDPGEFLYWVRTSHGGYSPCMEIQNGVTLPNCVGYAWGRFMEIMKNTPTFSETSCKLTSQDAEMFFTEDADGYERSDPEHPETAQPRPGAIMCWRKGDKVGDGNGGHVAIVEMVLKDGSVVTSESAYQKSKPVYSPPGDDVNGKNSHFNIYHRTRGSANNWGMSTSDGYHFQGFIYNPAVTSTGSVIDYVSKSQVTSKNDWVPHFSAEMKLNARYVWQYFGSRGWSLNAVAGMLGNMQAESRINPGIWQNCEMPTTDFNYTDGILDYYIFELEPGRGSHGYGLVQWTPYTNYTKWCKEMITNPEKNTYGVTGSEDNKYGIADMDNALRRIEWEIDNNKQWGGLKAFDYMTFKEFTTSSKDARWLAEAFLKCYERPANQGESVVKYRGDNAEFWYEYLLPYAPGAKPSLNLDSTKVSEATPTSLKVSCITRSAAKVTCKLYKTLSGDDELLIKEISEELETEESLEETEQTEDKEQSAFEKYAGKVLYFDFNNLTPNTDYRILVKVAAETATSEVDADNADADNADVLEESIMYTTPQSYPESVSAIKLLPSNPQMPNDEFLLAVTTISDWGYWVKNKHGYVIQLIVNGCVRQEKTLNNISESMSFSLVKYFKEYEKKLEDTIQIGIRTWVTDNNGNVLFDRSNTNASNAVSFLRQPFIAYLNTD